VGFTNINQTNHKVETSKDFPCTIGMQFFVRKNYLCCSVSSRSTDIYTGLPYDMGFFAFVTELIYKDLKERLDAEKAKNLKLGYVVMKTNFTQIY
jgi:thymidylate synthase